MAKSVRAKAWAEYLKTKKAGQRKKGTPLVSWGKLSVDLDRLDLALNTMFPGKEGIRQTQYFNEKLLKWLKGELDGKKTKELQIYHSEINQRILTFYWHINPAYTKVKGQGPVDFEGSCTNLIIDKLEEAYTSQGEPVEDVRARDTQGGFTLEHGDLGGTGSALHKHGSPEAASKRIKGLKAQREVIDALVKAVRKTNSYTSYIEAAIFDWMDCNFNLTTAMKKNRSIEDIFDLWQGEGTITLGQDVVPGTTIPANSNKVDGVIRKEFEKWLRGKEFLNDILKYVKKLSIKERLKVFSASEPLDAAFVKYGAGAFAAVFTKSGKLDKRYKINKQLIANAKPDTKKNSAISKAKKATNSILINRKAKGAKAGSRRQQQPVKESPVALAELINAGLSDEILQRMHPPALRNRTGRFRRSARVTSVIEGPRGGTEIQYTYMKDPYQTFEPGYLQGSTYRDPRKIIGESIREVAQKLMGNKFIKVRRV